MAVSDKKFRKRVGYERTENVRTERSVTAEEKLLAFNFKDFDASQPAGQSFEDWQKAGLLADLMEKLRCLSQWTMREALNEQQMAVYGGFPAKSDFTPPKHVASDVQWAVVKRVKGQKGRVAGYVIDNVFYPVFLDKDHRFWLTEKRRT